MILKLRRLFKGLGYRILPITLINRVKDSDSARRIMGVKSVTTVPDGYGNPLWERSRHRWRVAEPDIQLTWGRNVSGQAFVDKVTEFIEFAPDRDILEIGPGYGRLLREILSRDLPFRSYRGLDLSQSVVTYLRDNFVDPRISFEQGDVETASIGPFDIGMSSLVFKHFYPSFSAALENCVNALRRDGRFFFDLIEGERKYFQADGLTFISSYLRDEVEEILSSSGLGLIAFDEVWHDNAHRRLFVVVGR